MLTERIQEAYFQSPPYIYWDNFFSEEELSKMDEYFKSLPLEDAGIGEGDQNRVDEKYRKTNVSFVKFNDENRWIFYRLFQFTEMINNHFYQFELLGFNYLQYTVYDTEGSHYEFHIDMFENRQTTQVPRKLSCSLILSDSSEYEGGEFEFQTGKEAMKAEQIRGRVLAFPSYVLHRVTPVTKGIRRSLVWWACGPKYK